ncbi:MAG: hypothetical protein J6Y24_12115 [Bacteroidales bacterium]|nr:hypothetical protein [Bacteroidales bacterium]
MYSDTFIILGKVLKAAADGSFNGCDGFEQQAEALAQCIDVARNHNGWFTPEFVKMQFRSLAEMLSEDSVRQFSVKYQLNDIGKCDKKVKVIAAGNIPLVCFHDILCVLMAGCRLVVKPSSKDRLLTHSVLEIIKIITPELGDRIEEEEGERIPFDAIIATGSNNSARYFDYYFAKYPNIIRSNRSSVAVLSGKECEDDYRLLADDIFAYYGLGCRSVSKIYVPKGYNYDLFFKGIYHKSDVMSNAKYSDNYTYNKAVYLMSGADILDNGFLLLKKDTGLSSPVGVVFCEEYNDFNTLAQTLFQDIDKLQCVVSKDVVAGLRTVLPGQSQHPSINDFADGIDTVEFLKSLNH